MSTDRDIALADYWLHTATGALCDQARARIAIEVRAHYLDLVEAHVAEGMPLIEARMKALEELGDAKVAARRFRKQHWTKNDERALHGTLEYSKVSGPLVSIIFFTGMIVILFSRQFRIELGIAAFITCVVLPVAASILARRVKGENGIIEALLSDMAAKIGTGLCFIIFYSIIMDWSTRRFHLSLSAVILIGMGQFFQAIPSYLLLRKFCREQKRRGEILKVG